MREEIERKAKANGKHNAFPDEMSFGLTKREWFAGMALQGLLGNADLYVDIESKVPEAIDFADAILKQLAESDGAK
jgi:hypothetical protein